MHGGSQGNVSISQKGQAGIPSKSQLAGKMAVESDAERV